MFSTAAHIVFINTCDGPTRVSRYIGQALVWRLL